MTLPTESLQDYSMYYFLVDLFEPYNSGNMTFSIRDGFPTTELTKEDLPVIAVETSFLRPREFELGNRRYRDIRRYIYTAYGKDLASTRQYAYLIKNAIQDKVTVYNYNEGFPPTVVTSLGVLDPIEIEGNPIPVFPELTGVQYYRYEVIASFDYSVAPTS